MKLGSLFDGSGGFPLAGSMCGIEPVWASEIEPYPIAVTRSRFPKTKHIGNICAINGAEIEPVDIITFGSPCQDLSVAGKRAGLKHEANGDEETTRSGLFMEAVRIIKEMREATNGVYPRFALWENVPGAFSSNGGEDFRIVLEELIKVVEPTAVMPEVPKAGWAYADSYVGDGWSIAYRVFDAQYWGVPQRRRRIHLVADFRGECARKVLFEREGVRGDFTQSGETRQETAGDAESSIGADDREGKISEVIPINMMIATRHKQLGRGTGFGVAEIGDPQFTISAGHEHAVCYAVDQGGGKSGANVHDNISPTLTCTHGGEPAVAYSIENHPADSRVSIDESGKVQTLTSRMGTGGGNVPMVMESVCVADHITPKTDVKGKAFTLEARDYKCPMAVAFRQGGFAEYIEGEVGTLRASDGDYGGGSENLVCENEPKYIVRRLTPTECARLQGFPDRWGDTDHKEDFTDEEYSFWLGVRNTHAEINGKAVKQYTKEQMLSWYNKLHTDSAEYKMWGNGIALPPALYCMQGMAEILKEDYEK